MVIERASPIQLRKSLEIANAFVKAGVRFVPMPCTDDAEYSQRMRESIAKLDQIAAAATTNNEN